MNKLHVIWQNYSSEKRKDDILVLFTCQNTFKYCILFCALHLQRERNTLENIPMYEVKVKVTQSCPTLCDPIDCIPWNFPGQNIGVGSLSLLQGIFPTQESNRGLLHCRQILYQLSYEGSPLVGARAVKCDRDPEEGGIQAELYLRAHEWKMHS